MHKGYLIGVLIIQESYHLGGLHVGSLIVVNPPYMSTLMDLGSFTALVRFGHPTQKTSIGMHSSRHIVLG